MNAETARIGSEQHRINVLGRGSLEVCGVEDVISFDEQAVVLSTVCGSMEITGNALHIHILNIEQGIVAMNGRIDSIVYFSDSSGEKDSKNGFFSKLFR